MSLNNTHLSYIQSVNNLSIRNIGLTGKNPSVACLIVDYSGSPKGKVLSFGCTSKDGSTHAEVDALKKISNNKITNKTVMYVSLEPCFKEGDCCAKKIVKKGIKKVFISSLDPNPLIFKKGVHYLKKNNVSIFNVKITNNKFKEINKYFYTFQKKKRPYITLKLAISKNGYTKDFNNPNITSPDTQYYMHKYRLSHDAIAVGYNTFKEDKPKLNCRLNGINKRNYRFIISRHNKIKKFNLIKLDFKRNINDIFQKLERYEIKSILIEGGLNTFNYFFKNSHFDEIIICQSKNSVKISKPRYKFDQILLNKNLKLYSSFPYGDDFINIYRK